MNSDSDVQHSDKPRRNWIIKIDSFERITYIIICSIPTSPEGSELSQLTDSFDSSKMVAAESYRLDLGCHHLTCCLLNQEIRRSWSKGCRIGGQSPIHSERQTQELGPKEDSHKARAVTHDPLLNASASQNGQVLQKCPHNPRTTLRTRPAQWGSQWSAICGKPDIMISRTIFAMQKWDYCKRDVSKSWIPGL